DKDGEWFVWTMRGMSFKNLRQLKKYVLTQRIGEIGGYDNAAMGKILAELDGDLVGTGVREKELVSFLAKVGEPAIPEIKSTYSIVVECKGEKQQVQLLKRFQAMGLKTRAIVT
ncbi:MAG TPA: hypothetical protein VG871_05160, partial [Vicinamibacterales bacterium]|nr:hypothetical protein [Vicinamibacterales bacterium]